MGELQWFLGISIVRNRNERELRLKQSSYISKIATRFGVKKCSRQYSTPLPPFEVFTLNIEDAFSSSRQLYQQKIGSLQYAATTTRPDIANAAARLARYLQNPSQSHHQLADQVLRYLYQTRNTSLAFKMYHSDDGPVFIAYSDAARRKAHRS